MGTSIFDFRWFYHRTVVWICLVEWNFRGNSANVTTVPLPNNKVFIWGSFKSALPAAGFIEGVKGLNAVVNAYQAFRGNGIPEIMEEMEEVRKIMYLGWWNQAKAKRGCMAYFSSERVPTVWYKQHAVLIGDAAHHLSPNIHQVYNVENFANLWKGASQALIDSYTLGKLLAECGNIFVYLGLISRWKLSKSNRKFL